MFEKLFFERGLSVTEVKVAELLAQGLTNKEIGDQVFVSDKTIKFHMTRIMKKLGLKSRAAVIVMAWKYYVESLESVSGLPKSTVRRG